MKNKLILLGLNELNFDYIKFYIDQGLLPNFKKIFELHLFNYRGNVHIIACEAINNTKITNGMDWLANAI